jgi:hypothetical protein
MYGIRHNMPKLVEVKLSGPKSSLTLCGALREALLRMSFLTS